MAHPISHPSSIQKQGGIIRRFADLFRRSLAGPNPYEAGDAGRPEEPRPVIEIKAGLITNLMSMR